MMDMVLKGLAVVLMVGCLGALLAAIWMPDRAQWVLTSIVLFLSGGTILGVVGTRQEKREKRDESTIAAVFGEDGEER